MSTTIGIVIHVDVGVTFLIPHQTNLKHDVVAFKSKSYLLNINEYATLHLFRVKETPEYQIKVAKYFMAIP